MAFADVDVATADSTPDPSIGLGGGVVTQDDLCDGVPSDWQTPAPAHELAQRSMTYVERAAMMGFSGEAAAARWLYTSGTLHPPDQERRPATSWAFDRALAERFERHERPGWAAWTQPEADPSSPPLHKVYISPWRVDSDWLESLVVSFRSVCPAAVKAAALTSTPGRPDKLIVYFDSTADRDSWLVAFERPAGRTHGVPFTQQVGAPDISIATDPVPHAEAPQSWRSMCAGLIAPMIAALDERDATAVRRTVSYRLARLGIDVATWARIDAPG